MREQLERAFKWYLANQDALVEKYDGKVIALREGEVLGVYDTDLTAVTETRKSYEQSTFIVQRVSEGDGDYTVIINSPRVLAPSADFQRNPEIGVIGK